MTPLRATVLATSLILISLAVFGASSASATAFCEVNESPCPAEHTDGVPLALELELKAGTEALFTSSLGLSGKCPAATAKGELSEESGGALVGKITEMTFAKCSAEGCTPSISAQNLPYRVEVKATEGGDGAVKLSSGGSGNPRIKFNCGSLECAYGSSEVALLADGSEAPVFAAEKVSLPKETGGVLCGKSATWSAKYALTGYESIYFVQVGKTTALCEAAPNVKMNALGEKYLECPKKAFPIVNIVGSLGVGETIALKSTKGPKGTITCTSSALAIELASDGAAWGVKKGITAWTFNNGVGKPCTSTLGNNPNVTVTSTNLPYDRSRLVYRSWSPAEGTATFEGPKSALPTLELTFEKSTCDYEMVYQAPTVVNASGKTPTALFSAMVWTLVKEAGGGCPEELSLSTWWALALAGGGNVYVAEK